MKNQNEEKKKCDVCSNKFVNLKRHKYNYHGIRYKSRSACTNPLSEVVGVKSVEKVEIYGVKYDQVTLFIKPL